jgi:orotate phosphoribosyltransferase
MSSTCFDIRNGELLADELLKIKAIKLNTENPFTWASGWKSPIYCDNRLSLSYPKLRTDIKNMFVSMIKKHFPKTEAIAGVATAGIPQGCLIAEALEIPFLYVRSSSKSHGLANQIEGKITTGQKVLLIEDLISTGGSSLGAATALRTAGMSVLGMGAIFTYGFDVAVNNFEKAGIDLIYLSEYKLLISLALQKQYIDQKSADLLAKWRESPDKWKN